MNIILSGCCGAMGNAIYRLSTKNEGSNADIRIVAGIDKNQNTNCSFKVFQTAAQYINEADGVDVDKTESGNICVGRIDEVNSEKAYIEKIGHNESKTEGVNACKFKSGKIEAAEITVERAGVGKFEINGVKTNAINACGTKSGNFAEADAILSDNIKVNKTKADVVVDFSHPDLFNDILSFCVEMGLPLICGTTGLSQEQHALMNEAAHKIPIFYATNMSFGVYVFNKLITEAAMLLHEGFDIEIIEKHHRFKADSPSGTAVTILQNLKEINPGLAIVAGRSGKEKRKAGDVGISSVRGGTIVGEHEVVFAGDNEVIQISHSAQSKDIFAAGALLACKFLATQKAGLYGMDSLVDFSAG